MELVEAELVIPFVGTLTREVVSPGLADFYNVSLLAEDIDRSGISDIWSIRITIGKTQPDVLRLEKYEASTVS